MKPQSLCTDEETLAHTNLLACCQGEGAVSRKPEHCGQKRGSELLDLTPLDESCTHAFLFTEDGQILANPNFATHCAAESVIQILGLNISKLQRMRKSAIANSLQGIETWTLEEKQKLLQFLEQRNEAGQYTEFCSAIVNSVKQYLP